MRPTIRRSMTNITITFPNGRKFSLPLSVPQKSMAAYYSEREEVSFTSAFADAQALGADEAIDWLRNNMDWSDVEHLATEIPTEIVTLESQWGDAEVEVAR